MLLGAGVRSLASGKLRISLARRMSWPFIGVLVIGVGLLAMQSYVFDVFLTTPTPVRILAAAALLFTARPGHDVFRRGAGGICG